MAEKRKNKSSPCKLEIAPLHEHRRVSLRCLNCEEFLLMDIQKKTRVKGKVNYYVTCPQCGYKFKQVGRPYNYWRDIKQRYRLGHTQLRSMQGGMVRKLLKTGKIAVKETEEVIQIGDTTFIKPKHSDTPE